MKITMYWAAFLVIFGAVSGPAAAQTRAAALTLEECVRKAQAAPSSLQIARAQSQIAGLGIKEAQAAMLPTAAFDSGFTYNSPLKGASPLQSFTALNGVREHLFLLSANQPIDISGRLRADRKRASADLDAAEAGVKITQRDLKRAVTAAYYGLLLARHLTRALRDSVTEAESFEKRTRALIEQGEAAQADLAKASAATAAFRQAQSIAELEEQLASQELASFWTSDVNEQIEIVDVFAEVPGVGEAGLPAGAKPFVNRPEFGLLEAQRRSLLAESTRIRANLLPQANVAFQYGLDSTVWRAADHGYAVFVSLNVPIFDWKRTWNASREFQFRAQQTETQRSMAERAFSREYEAARARIKNALDQISLAEQQVKLSEEDLRLSRLRFEGGEGPALDVVSAQNQLTQARVSYFAAVAGYWNARADREVAAGQ